MATGVPKQNRGKLLDYFPLERISARFVGEVGDFSRMEGKCGLEFDARAPGPDGSPLI